MAHAIPSRVVRDLGDALVLHDPRDPDPFWNRMVSVRWPASPRRVRSTPRRGGDDVRPRRAAAAHLAVARAQRARRTSWPASSPTGSADVGGGHVMVLTEPASCPPLAAGELAAGVTVAGICRATDAMDGDVDDIAAVLAESFGALPDRAGELAADLRPDARRPADRARADPGRRGAGGGREGDVVRRVHLPVVDRDARALPRPRPRRARDAPRRRDRAAGRRPTSSTSACSAATPPPSGCTSGSGSRPAASRRTSCSSEDCGPA